MSEYIGKKHSKVGAYRKLSILVLYYNGARSEAIQTRESRKFAVAIGCLHSVVERCADATDEIPEAPLQDRCSHLWIEQTCTVSLLSSP